MIATSKDDRTQWSGEVPPSLSELDIPLGLRTGVLGRKWALLILRRVAGGGRSTFTQLLGVHHSLSRRVLSMRLRELQREGYLEKIVVSDKPVRAYYRLAQKGRDALPVLQAFSRLVKRYGEGVSVSNGRKISVEDVCFAHPDIPRNEPTLPAAASIGPSHVFPSDPRVIEYKGRCERCKTPLAADAEAYVCSFECTWCRKCTEGFGWLCPNCEGKLQPRPRLETGELIPGGLGS